MQTTAKATEHHELQSAVEDAAVNLFHDAVRLSELAHLDLYSLVGIRIEIDFTQDIPTITTLIASTDDERHTEMDVRPPMHDEL